MNGIKVSAKQLGVGTMAYAQVINSFPYSEDFEGEGSNTQCSGYVMTAVGWENDLVDGGNDWAADVNGTGSSNTGPTANSGADHNPGVAGGKYMYTETSGCNNDQRNLLMP